MTDYITTLRKIKEKFLFHSVYVFNGVLSWKQIKANGYKIFIPLKSVRFWLKLSG